MTSRMTSASSQRLSPPPTLRDRIRRTTPESGVTLTIRARQRRRCRTGQLSGSPFRSVTVPGRRSARLAADQRPEEELMSKANKDLVRRHFEELWNRQDLTVADELMAQDYLEHALAPFGQAEPGRVNGPAASRETAAWLLAQFPDLHMTIEAMVAEG